MIEIKFYKDINNSELEFLWNNLYQIVLEENIISHPFLFNHYHWSKSWISNIKKDNQEFRCILVKIGQDPIIIMPMLVERFININFAELIGGKETDYQNILINKFLYLKNKSEISTILKRIFYEKKIYYFRNKSINDELTLLFLKDLFRFSFKFKYDESSYLRLSQFSENIPKKVRKQIIRVEKKNKIENKIINQENKEFNSVINDLVHTKNDHYISNKVKIMPNERINFYRDIASKNFAHFSYTKINNNYASFHLGIKNRDSLIYLLPTYKKKYRTLSPGWIHLDFLIMNSIKNNIQTIDLTIGNEAYKQRLNCKKLNIFYFFGLSNIKIVPFFIIEFLYRKMYNSKKIRNFYYFLKGLFVK